MGRLEGILWIKLTSNESYSFAFALNSSFKKGENSEVRKMEE